jgi:hypothetical protein
MIVIFKVVKYSSVADVIGLSVAFTIEHFKNGFLKLIKNNNVMSNKDS